MSYLYDHGRLVQADRHYSGNEVLQTSGSVSAEEAKVHAETEFEKYRIIQDRIFQSDFDRFLGEMPFIDDSETK